MEPVPTQTAYVESDQSKLSLRTIILKGGITLLLIVIILGLLAYFVWPIPGWRAMQQIEEVGSAFDTNDLDGAIAKADAILQTEPDNAGILAMKALALAQKGSIGFKEEEFGAQAVTVAQQAVQADSESSEAYRALAYAYEIQEKYKEAHENYEKAIALDSGNALAIFGNAHSYDLEGNMILAEEGYRKALALDPTFDQAHAGLGRALVARGDIDDAITSYKQALNLARNVHNKAEHAYSIGSLLLVKNNSVEAKDYAEMATTFDPQYPLGWYGLGKAQIAEAAVSNAPANDRVTMIQQSLASFSKALELNPGQSLVHLELARINLTIFKKYDVARMNLDSAEVTAKSDITLNATAKNEVLENIATLRTMLPPTVEIIP
jgi:tetratricopeptide (TPR) repeat protein